MIKICQKDYKMIKKNGILNLTLIKGDGEMSGMPALNDPALHWESRYKRNCFVYIVIYGLIPWSCCTESCYRIEYLYCDWISFNGNYADLHSQDRI